LTDNIVKPRYQTGNIRKQNRKDKTTT